MAARIAKFSKVSFDQFMKDWCDTFHLIPNDPNVRKDIESIYGGIELPTRATAGSAGYDFHSPLTFSLEPGDTIKIPTGIRCWMSNGWVLMAFPRSGLGFKYRLQLNNTVGIVDEDYFYSDNEGHIFIKITNDSKEDKTVKVLRGNGFAQGIFVSYGITVDDDTTVIRNGGFGSTDINARLCGNRI